MTATNQKRERDGKYSHDGDLTRLCVCGHTLGQHSCERPAQCLAHADPVNDHDRQCRCSKFRLSRKGERR